jgi:putative thioredoxin
MSVVEVTEETFERDVVERSHEAPVVIDFWAEWCGPCRALGPILERLATEADGSWTLAKVDVDANQRLAAAFGVQGIPAVKAVRDGKLVAEFTGALPESQVREWLQQLGPTEGELAVAEGRAAEARGDLEAAARSYRRALEVQPGNPEARSALSRVELQLRAGDGADEASLRARLGSDPADIDAAVTLGDLLAARGDFEGAFGALLAAVRGTTGERRDRARVHLVGLLDALPADDPRAMQARRSLAAALF